MRKFVALMAAAVMLFAFCASANAATQVTIWHTFTDAQQAALEKFAADFNASQSDYEVVVESQAYSGFLDNVYNAVANGVGMVRLHPVALSARSQMTGREMNGRVRRLMYLDGSTFAPAYDDGSTISFPARTLHFLNIGSGVGQILHGSVCLRMQCSVGTKHMPESTAIFTILI